MTRHGSLFTGIGGFDLAAEMCGWTNIFQVEKDDWCRRVLAKNFPNAYRHSDIYDFDGTPYRGAVDVVSGGFPCQPYSVSGKRTGTADPRHLWPEMLRVVREIAPTWVVGENVRGLVSWSGGLVFEQVQADLEAAGYEVQPFLLPAASVGAWHERCRVWIVAHRAGERVGRVPERPGRQGEAQAYSVGAGEEWAAAHANRERRGKLLPTSQPDGARFTGWRDAPCWQNGPTQPGVCRGNDGLPHRLDRIRGLGNAVVPQLVVKIFRAISDFERSQNI